MSIDSAKKELDYREYGSKVGGCVMNAQIIAFFGGTAGAFLTPYILRKLSFIPTTFEVRAALGLLSFIPAGYFAGKYKKLRCLEKVDANYIFKSE